MKGLERLRGVALEEGGGALRLKACARPRVCLSPSSSLPPSQRAGQDVALSYFSSIIPACYHALCCDDNGLSL